MLLTRNASIASATFVYCIIGLISGCSGSTTTFEKDIHAKIQPAIPACAAATEAPWPASESGFNGLKFCDDFDDPNTIDISGSGKAGYKWYTNLPFGWGQTKPSAYSVSGSVLSVTSTLPVTCNWALTTKDPQSGNGDSWSFGYFEARISFDPGLASQSVGWPAFWAISATKTRYPETSRYSELDFFEGMIGNGGRIDGFLGSINDWQSNMSIRYLNSNQWQETKIDWSQWHTVGLLWKPGSVEWYLDGNPLMRQEYSVLGSPQPLAATEHGSTPTPPGTFSNIDIDPLGQQIVLGSDSNWPLKVDWVRVWQN